MRILAIAAISLIAGGCSTTHIAECDAGDVQQFVGQRASSEIGDDILDESGAKTLRWAPPRSAMTMDFRPDRVTVVYDDNYAIEMITCG